MGINMTFKTTGISTSAEGTMVGIIQLVLRETEAKMHCSCTTVQQHAVIMRLTKKKILGMCYKQ
jgi:hypothetical protein